MKGVAIVLAAGLLLAGCTREPEAPSLWVAEPGLVFCYATIADPDCGKAPVPGAELRLIAVAPSLTFAPRALSSTTPIKEGATVLVEPERR